MSEVLEVLLRIKAENAKAFEQISGQLDKLRDQSKKFNEEQKKHAAESAKALNAMKGEVESLARSMAQNLGPAGNVLASLGPKGLVAAAGIGAMALAVSKAAEFTANAVKGLAQYSDRISTLSERYKIGVVSLQKWDDEARKSGTDLEALAKGAANVQLAIAKGDTIFQRLGLSLKELRRSTPEEALRKVADAVDRVSSQSGKIAAAREAFGKAGDALIPMLRALADGTPDVDRFGLALSEAGIKGAKELNDKAVALNDTWVKTQRQFAETVIQTGLLQDGIGKLTTALGKFGQWFRDNKSDIVGFFNLVHASVVMVVNALATAVPGMRAFIQAAEVYARLQAGGAPGRGGRAGEPDEFGNQQTGSGGIGAPTAVPPPSKRAPIHFLTPEQLAVIQRNAELAGKVYADVNARIEKNAQESTAKQIAFAQALARERTALAEKVRLQEADIREREARLWEQRRKNDAQALGESQRFMAEAMARGQESAALAIARVNEQIDEKIRKLEEERNITADVYDEAISNYERARQALIRYIKTMDLADTLGKLGGLVGNISNLFEALGADAESAGVRIANALATGLQTGSNIAQALAKGDTLGAISAGIGGAASIIGGLFGKGRREKKESEDLRRQFAEAHGGMEALRKKAQELGVSIDKAFTSNKPAEVKAVMEQMEKAIEAAEKRAEGFAIAMDGIQGAFASFSPDEGKGGNFLGGIMAANVEGASAQAEIFGAVWAKAIKEKGLVGAADALRDAFTRLWEDVSTVDPGLQERLLGPIQRIMEMTKPGSEEDPAGLFRGAAEGAQNLAKVLGGLAQAEVPLTISQFQAFGQQAQAAFQQALSGGATQQEAFAAVGPLLQQIISAHQQYGTEIDANTQALIDQAAANGVAFSSDPTDRLRQSIDALTLAMGGIPPKFDEAAQRASTTFGAAIPAATQQSVTAVQAFGSEAVSTFEVATTLIEERGLEMSKELATQWQGASVLIDRTFSDMAADVSGSLQQMKDVSETAVRETKDIISGLPERIRIPIDFPITAPDPNGFPGGTGGSGTGGGTDGTLNAKGGVYGGAPWWQMDRMAAGGLVNYPGPGVHAIVGERGPEVVAPVDALFTRLADRIVAGVVAVSGGVDIKVQVGERTLLEIIRDASKRGDLRIHPSAVTKDGF